MGDQNIHECPYCLELHKEGAVRCPHCQTWLRTSLARTSSMPERPRQGRVLWGVCAGMARHLDVDVTLVRLGFIGLTFYSGYGVPFYVVMRLLMPEESPQPAGWEPAGPVRTAP